MPSPRILSICITCMAQCLQWEAAFALLTPNVDAVCFNAALGALTPRQWPLAVVLLHEMRLLQLRRLRESVHDLASKAFWALPPELHGWKLPSPCRVHVSLNPSKDLMHIPLASSYWYPAGDMLFSS